MRLFSSCILLCVLIWSCTSNDVQEDQVSSIRSGKFLYQDVDFGTYQVIRTDSLQRERLVRHNLEVEFGIEWQDDSTYQLFFHKIKSNPDSLLLPDDIHDLVKTCWVKNVTDSSYVEMTTSNLNSDTNYTTMVIVN